ncbi:MAG: RidA family protein [Eubacteriales bacterium]|nr:RidA family protein [Eubacteriales bacterium]
MKKLISTPNAPAAIGPYSQGVACSGSLVFVSGQLPVNPQTGSFAGDTIEELTHQSIKNVIAILNAAGCSLCDVVKTTVYLSDMNDFAAMNAVYSEYFTQGLPARAAVEVARLPKNARIEIEAIAVKQEN